MGTEAAIPPATGPANRKKKVSNGNGNGVELPRWILAVLGALLTAGILASINTTMSVERLDENVGLMRQEVRREFDEHSQDIRAIETKLDAHMLGELGRGNGGGS